MRFEWDGRRARANVAKHGVSFEVGITTFDDPFALLADDASHSTRTEQREWLIGESDRGVLVVVFTRREQGRVYRLISARTANRQERKQYEDAK